MFDQTPEGEHITNKVRNPEIILASKRSQMQSTNWSSSTRKYKDIIEHDVKIPISDGIKLDVDVIRPDSDDKFPVILSLSPYPKEAQYGPMMPTGMSSSAQMNPGEEKHRGHLESGDPTFYARRGYVHVIGNLRGTGKSGGDFQGVTQREAKDLYEAIEWLSSQPYCDGNVGMMGVSYFALMQWQAAATNPPHLKCIFAPWASLDRYREVYYRGGILAASWAIRWSARSADWPKNRSDPKAPSMTKKVVGEKKFQEMISEALKDPSIQEIPELVNALKNPDKSANNFIVDILLHPYDDSFWKEKAIDYAKIKVPCFFGGDLSPNGLHITTAFNNWDNLKVPKKIVIGPPFYLDRPVYQLQWESLRWFDHWLKGINTGFMDEPNVRIFVMGSNDWKYANELPLPNTKWTPFYLHENGLLAEHEYWHKEGFSTFFDSPWGRGSLDFVTPYFVEKTEIIGRIAMDLFGSTSLTDILWFVTLFVQDSQANSITLSRGWLRGSHRAVDESRSKPWAPYHPHVSSEPLVPDNIYEFKIQMLPISYLFSPGTRLGIRISCSDKTETPRTPNEATAFGHISGQSISRVTVYHDADNPSHVLLPITSGNIIGMYFSGKPI